MTYSGNRLFNINNAIPAGFLLLFGIIGKVTLHNIIDSGYWIIIIVSFFIAVIDSFYFEITEDDFIVKNYLLPFMKIRYPLNEITEIQLLNSSYRSTAKASLKVIRDDKISFGFKGASLGVQDWQNMVNDLRTKKIKVVVQSIALIDKIGIPE
ncbi:MAG: hypothetical protein JWQ34_1965 [Mucilaginibacter sp.]|uniref:hypothetical protein n=1 Tax=Mucilaginibacter sp. TaxID=1882438 RepID=UPI00260BC31B|nr:hypothetical protein [Mucilaginibacter sp.]MDB5003740.1 hypothetical protein [Mucilaginibacter sp.]